MNFIKIIKLLLFCANVILYVECNKSYLNTNPNQIFFILSNFLLVSLIQKKDVLMDCKEAAVEQINQGFVIFCVFPNTFFLNSSCRNWRKQKMS